MVLGAANLLAERAFSAAVARRSVKANVKPTDPKSRRRRAARALAIHPRAEQNLKGVDFRDPTPRELATAASMKDRALRVRSRHAAAT